MPIRRVTTKSANKVWTSPDGKIEMFELGLEWEGKALQAKTYSKAIAVPGWSGEVESYDKTDNKGTVETFVKQPPKDDGQGGQSYGSRGGTSGSGKFQADPFTMYLSYAKDLKVALVTAHPEDHPGDKYTDMLDDIVAGAYVLYEGRPSAETKATEAAPASTASPVAQVFNSGEPLPEEDDPWHPKTT